jgi:muramoyltetrapeptide carboxypeptidase LdcA involved in peptidoglycan recycling
MKILFPEKLKKGDEVRIIAPSRSLRLIGEETRRIAHERFGEMGLRLSFGKHVNETDDFASTSIEARIEDLHDGFSDKNIKAVLTVIGGFNSNQLLRYIDWNLIQAHPKIFCGYSDITALNNAIFAKTGLVTYSGPHYSSFGQKLHFEYSLDYFKKCLFSEEHFEIEPSEKWSDDPWYLDQDKRDLIPNKGFITIHEGEAEGTILGANLCTLNLLQGTEYTPELNGAVLFLEDDYESVPHTFDRDLQSLIHQKGFEGVRGIVIGRFQKASKMTEELLRKIIDSKKELEKIPVIAGADFGHSDPKITFPIGGKVLLKASQNKIQLKILEH